jgi:hypothetical protein
MGAARGGGAEGSGARRERLPDFACASCVGLAATGAVGADGGALVLRRRDDEAAGAA